jgi:hypothetical protein
MRPSPGLKGTGPSITSNRGATGRNGSRPMQCSLLPGQGLAGRIEMDAASLQNFRYGCPFPLEISVKVETLVRVRIQLQFLSSPFERWSCEKKAALAGLAPGNMIPLVKTLRRYVYPKYKGCNDFNGALGLTSNSRCSLNRYMSTAFCQFCTIAKGALSCRCCCCRCC